MTSRITHFIAGREWTGASERTAPVFDPATGVAGKAVDLASRDVVDSAVKVAATAFVGWREVSLTKRIAILFAFRELLNSRKEELAEIITGEHGKVLSDALGEITRGQEVVEFACGLGHLLKGGFSEQVSAGVDRSEEHV